MVDISLFTSTLTDLVGVNDILNLLASAVGICLGFILVWFGVKQAYLYFMSALLGYKFNRGLIDDEDFWIDGRGRFRGDW